MNADVVHMCEIHSTDLTDAIVFPGGYLAVLLAPQLPEHFPGIQLAEGRDVSAVQ